jgi:hypothetical protein
LVSHEDIQSALRTKLMTLSVCEAVEGENPLTLGASASGYTRTDGGSFIDDGFAVGMEVLATGFTGSNNGSKMITAVSATLLSCAGCSVQAAAEGRTLEVGLPSSRAWEQARFTRQVGVTHVVEQYLPGPESAPAAPNDKELRPVYVVQVFVPANTGIEADARYAEAIKQLFNAKVSVPVGTSYIRGRAEAASYLGQRNFAVTGFSMIPVTIPLRLRTQITP